MLPLRCLPNLRQTATKRIALCCGLIGLSALGILGFGQFPLPYAAERLLPNQRKLATPATVQSHLAASYARLPLSFEANHGQVDSRVRFLARGGGYAMFLMDEGAVLTLRKSSVIGRTSLAGKGQQPEVGIQQAGARIGHTVINRGLSPTMATVQMRLVGANSNAEATGTNELPGKTNYFIGNDPKKWRTNIPNYGQVKFSGVYPGVDLVYYGNQRQIEYDFMVAPGADPDQIKMSFAGADHIHVDAASGDLVLKIGDGEVRFHKPDVYQPSLAAASLAPSVNLGAGHSSRATLPSSFVLAGNNEVAFHVDGYDPRRALVIDPVLSYSTYLGGPNQDEAGAITVDSAGSAYITGETASTNFPTVNPLQAQCASCGGWDAFVAKLNPGGTALVYSTFLGGTSDDYGIGIAVDAAGNSYITGGTTSTDFPTHNPLQPTYGGLGDAFVAKLNPAGNALVYSTYLGASAQENGLGIAIDSAGNAYVAGDTYSPNFPTASPLQANNKGNADAFVAKLNPAGSALVYSTFLGGSDEDGARGIAIDAAGNAYVTGFTKSTDFPTSHPIQAASGGGTCGMGTQTYNCPDAFVAKLNPAGSALVYSTYLGGSDQDFGNGIAIDSGGSAYITGYTLSADFPTVNPLQSQCDNCSTVYGGTNAPVTSGDAFVAKINAAGSALAYSTYLGGIRDDAAGGIAVDAAGNAYVAGGTKSPDFPAVNAIQPVNSPYGTAFVSELNSTGAALIFSTFLGGAGTVPVQSHWTEQITLMLSAIPVRQIFPRSIPSRLPTAVTLTSLWPRFQRAARRLL